MTDAERESCLRRLRFPGELEVAFQGDYYRRVVPGLRIGLALMALTMTAQGIGWYLQSNGNLTLLPLVIARLLPLVAFFALTFRRGFWRWWQVVFVALLAMGLPLGMGVIGKALADGRFWSGGAAQLAYLGMLTLYGMVMLFGMLRLQFGWTAVYQLLLVGCSVRAAMVHIPLPPGNILTTYGYIHLPALLMVLAASYAYERLERAAFLGSHLLEIERARSETLLRNTLPGPIVDRLMASSDLIADDHAEVTVLFGDIAGFTPWSEGRPAHAVLEFLNEVFSRFDRLVETHGLEKIKTVGDCYMVVAGAPLPRADHVEAAARLALAMQAEVRQLSEARGYPISFRIGIHTGPLAAGVIGEKRFLYDVWGDTVNTASRLESHGIPGAIQVSTAVMERLRDRFTLQRRGEVEIKGKGVLETFLLEGETAAGTPTP